MAGRENYWRTDPPSRQHQDEVNRQETSRNWRYAQLGRRTPDEEFDLRGGWRMGSDYYGNNPERYTIDRHVDFEVRSYGTSGDRGERSFNDRWKHAYRGCDSSRAGPFGGRGPKGYRRSDESLLEDVCERLTQDERIDASDIEVTVTDCEITLSGSVSSREEKRLAEDLVAYLRGVRDVHNRLSVMTPENQSSRAAHSWVSTR
jgi:hypothetical protein